MRPPLCAIDGALPEGDWLQLINGKLYHRHSRRMSDGPEIRYGWYPVAGPGDPELDGLDGMPVSDGYRDTDIRIDVARMTAEQLRTIRGSWLMQNGRWRYPNAGKTCESCVYFADIPAPKVRKGVEVRWSNYEWQKLLKRGWISAEGDK
jgi:hypothetical protein